MERDRVTREAARIPGAIPLLVMAPDDRDGADQERNLLDEPLADLRVRAHHPPLVRCERAGLEEDRIRNADLADVVEKHAVGEVGQLIVRHVVGAGERQRVAVDAA